MRKLVNGILEFRRTCLSHYLENFSHLGLLGQSPDALLIACSDSRVAPNVFASTNPGDLFVIRNVGNIVPAFSCLSEQSSCSEAAALAFSLHTLPIKDIIICGHSDCGAMQAILSGTDRIHDPHLKSWLGQCGCSKEQLSTCTSINKQLVLHNQLAQLSVLQQMAHLKTYPLVQQKIQEGRLNIHGWYFDIAKGDVYNFEEEYQRFTLIDEDEAQKILLRLR